VAERVLTPSRREAAAAVPVGGSVLDVGAGAGAASLPLAPPAGEIVGIDESAPMLEAFAAGAEHHGVRHTEIPGRWPDVAGDAPQADVVVCHHVFYNVADLAPFVEALDAHARRRVVVELTEVHPQSDLNPLWRSIHGLERPTEPTAADAAEIVRLMGYDVQVERFERSSLWYDAPIEERLAFARRRLCVGREHDAEIAAFVTGNAATPRRLVTLWWDRRHPPD
jgi:SAM-dependent methyltransferase